jgi:hypothetical protein
LREAITAATARGDEITFSSLFDTPQTITLSDAAGFRELSISDKTLSIRGKGAQLLTIRRDTASSVNFAIFDIRRVTAANVTVALSGMSVTGGFSSFGAGGINVNGVDLTLTACHITGNSNGVGNGDAGGIVANNSASLSILNSTISNNTVLSNGALNSAGGIKFNGNQFIITNSTVSGNVVNGNSGADNSGGIFVSASSGIITNSTVTDNQANGTNTAGGVIGGSNVTARNTIIAGNRNNSSVPDVRGALTSGGYNLVGSTAGSNFVDGVNNDRVGTLSAPLDPLLDSLGSYGGATPTHRPRTNSQAIDKGNSFEITTDQRGSLRPVDMSNVANLADGADIGAFEIQIAPTAAVVSISGRVLTTNGEGLRNARVTLTDMNGNSRTIQSGKFGGFRFADVAAGETYIISVVSRHYIFQPQVVTVTEDITELNFLASTRSSGEVLESFR